MFLEYEERGRKIRAFVLALLGSFIFILSSIVTVRISSQPLYLGVAALSLGAVYMVYLAHKSHSLGSQIVYLISASATLAAETAAVALFFPELIAAAYSIATLGSCVIAARGIRDIETLMMHEEPYQRRKREIPAVQGGP